MTVSCVPLRQCSLIVVTLQLVLLFSSSSNTCIKTTSAFSFSQRPQRDLLFKTQTITTSSKTNSRSTSTTITTTHKNYIHNKSSSPTTLLFVENKMLETMGQDSKTMTMQNDKEEENDVGAAAVAAVDVVEKKKEQEEEMSESKKLLMKIKESGTAGVISYALWELGFWALSVPVCIYAYYKLVGHMPDFSNQEDLAKLGGEAFAFVNFARFAVPLRIGLALSTTPWIQENIVDSFLNNSKKDDKEE